MSVTSNSVSVTILHVVGTYIKISHLLQKMNKSYTTGVIQILHQHCKTKTTTHRHCCAIYFPCHQEAIAKTFHHKNTFLKNNSL